MRAGEEEKRCPTPRRSYKETGGGQRGFSLVAKKKEKELLLAPAVFSTFEVGNDSLGQFQDEELSPRPPRLVADL